MAVATSLLFLAMLIIAVVLTSVDSFQPIKASYVHLNRVHFVSNVQRNTIAMMATNDYNSYASKREIDVVVEAPTFNSRKITASIVVNSPVEDVWEILTEYERLAERVPNLVKSYIVSDTANTNSGYGNSREGYNSNSNNIGLPMKNKINARIFQEGAQKVLFLNSISIPILVLSCASRSSLPLILIPVSTNRTLPYLDKYPIRS